MDGREGCTYISAPHSASISQLTANYFLTVANAQTYSLTTAR